MDQLKAMRLFARVVDEGSFAAAARALDLAPAVVTRVIAELEAHLGARLLNRTTRRVALTEVGADYLERVRAILADVDEAEALAGAAMREVRGHLRVLVPPSLMVHVLARELPRFHAAYPQVTLEVVAPGPVETVDDDHDVTLFSTRRPPDGEFIARRLARAEVVLCASPAYLARHGRPRHPGEVSGHHAIVPPVADLQRNGLTFHRCDGGGERAVEQVSVEIVGKPLLATSHVDSMYAAALAGLGVAGLPSFVAAQALLDGRLERVLPCWRLFAVTIWAGVPSRKHLPARTRAFVDFALQVFGGQDRDPWRAAAGCESEPAAPAPAVSAA